MLLRMAWRNLWRNPRRTGVLVAAVSSGVAGALCAMALTNGMVVQMVDTAIRTELGHLQIHAYGFLGLEPFVDQSAQNSRHGAVEGPG